jgi:hypothetical protein
MHPEESTQKTNGQAMPETIVGRISTGRRFIERGLGERERIACKRFLDGSEASAYLITDDDNFDGVGVLPEAQEVGNVNYLAINILTKVAAVAIGDPDFHVDTGPDDPMMLQLQEGQESPELSRQDMAEIVRRFLRQLWETRGWARVFRKVLLKRALSGMGILAYLWHDEDGPLFETVRARDFACDPCVTDWRALHWAARRIRMRHEDARARYPKLADLVTSPVSDIPNLDEPSPLSRDTVELWVYWDRFTEATCYGEQVLEQGPNLYGRVPLLILEGDIAPESELSLGDYDTASQLQEMLARLQAMINNQAENGGAIGWYNPGLLDDTSKNAFDSGRPQEFIATQGDGHDVFGYIPGQPSDPMLMEAFILAQKGLDSATGVTEYQRGVINQSVKFATEAALLANQSGARGNQARIEFEQFVNFAARCLLQMVGAFAPSMMADGAPEDALLLQSLQAVQDIKVIEASTSYKDPSAEMQTNLQLLQAMMPFIQTGLVNPTPLIADVFRAFGKRDVHKYFQLPPSAQPGGPGGAAGGMPPGAPGSVPGGMPPGSGPPGPPASALPLPAPSPFVPPDPSYATGPDRARGHHS